MLGQRQKISEDLKKFMQTQRYSLNPQSRSHLFEPEEKPVLSDMIHMEHLLTVLQPVELFAAKINALLSRAAARDLYDTYNRINLGLFSNDGYVLRKFREREYCPKLLYDDEQVIRRITNHPMALWKIQEH